MQNLATFLFSVSFLRKGSNIYSCLDILREECYIPLIFISQLKKQHKDLASSKELTCMAC